MIKIAVNGAAGRMGTRILELAKDQPHAFQIAQTFDLKQHESLAPYAEGSKTLHCDVLIDFSGPEGAGQCNAAAAHSKKALVIGSTGLEDPLVHAIRTTATKVPVVLSSNMSVGVNVMVALLEKAAALLPEEFTIKMTEAHHRHKKDAPSGTAIMLADSIARGKKWDIRELVAAWRKGRFNDLSSNEKIGMHVIREGEIVGDHTVIFSGPAETLEITHRAQSRDTFARGALIAAQFAASAKPGLYSMADVLK